MTDYTPGPWKIHGGPAHLRHHMAIIDSIPDVDGKIVANCICHMAGTNDDIEANARLIAAAPDMLEALQKANRYLAEMAMNGGPKQGDEGMDEWSEAQGAIANAIRQATQEPAQ